jgi:hypothetical protein
VGLPKRNISEFIRSDKIKTLFDDSYTDSIYKDEQIEIYFARDKLGGRISLVRMEIVVAYWLWQSYRGNKKAVHICRSLTTESLKRPESSLLDKAVTLSLDEQKVKPLWERLVEIGRQVPDEEWAKLPTDLSWNFEHYMYGATKQDE